MTESLTQKFLLLFEQIKSATNESPSRLEWLCNENSSLKKNVEDLNTCNDEIKLRIKQSRRKFVAHVPDAFPSAYRKFRRSWEKTINDIANFELYHFLHEMVTSVTIEDPKDIRASDKKNNLDDDDVLEALVDYIEFKASDNDEWHFDEMLDVINLIKRSTNVKWADVRKRDDEFDSVFIPRSVSSKHGKETHSLFNLIEEAQRAYILGLDRAAIALCRAVTELVLEKHYLPNFKIDGRKAEFHELIDEVCNRQEFSPVGINKMNLSDKRRLANRIVHGSAYTENDLLSVRDWMKDLKILIENAPKLNKKLK